MKPINESIIELINSTIHEIEDRYVDLISLFTKLFFITINGWFLTGPIADISAKPIIIHAFFYIEINKVLTDKRTVETIKILLLPNFVKSLFALAWVRIIMIWTIEYIIPYILIVILLFVRSDWTITGI